jgi:hypothetical protein
VIIITKGLAGDKPTSNRTDADHSIHSHHNHLEGTMKASVKDNNRNRVFKDVAKASPIRLCNCPGSEPGKVKIDIDQHLTSCRFRKRNNRYASKTSVIPSKIVEGCSLGIVLGEEHY